MNYTISPVTTYDADNLLFETKIGLGLPNRTLLYSAWGSTKQESIERAQDLIDLLKKK